MIPIKKKSTPEILLEKQKKAVQLHLNSAEAYKLLNHAEKSVILESLMEEQGHLCAYCMRHIPDERALNRKNKDGSVNEDISPVTIEHWFPRNPSTGEERGQGLDYNNMLAVCSGNRGCHGTRKTRDLTCDAKRSKKHPQLTLNPVDSATLQSIQYSEDGIMFSTVPAVQDDITVKLNLNCVSEAVQLPDTRRKVLEMLQEEVYAKDRDNRLEYCQSVLRKYEEQTDPKTAYSGILIWWLRDYIQNP